MTPREIARIEAISLALREEALMERARVAHERSSPKPGSRRISVPAEVYARCLAVARQHPEASAEDVAEEVCCSTWHAAQALAQARRSGVLAWRPLGRAPRRTLEDVAEAWRALREPTAAKVAEQLGISWRSAIDRLQKARKAGLLPRIEATHRAGPRQTPAKRPESQAA